MDLSGRWPSPTILLTDAVDEVEPLKAAIRRQDREVPGTDAVGQVVTIFDLLPGRRKFSGASWSCSRRFAGSPTTRRWSSLNEREKADLPDRSVARPSPAWAIDLPPIAGARSRGRRLGGQGGARLSARARDLGLERTRSAAIASVLQTIKLDNGKVIETSGFAVVFGSMIRSVLHDGPIATVASLIAVLIIISFTIRPAAAALMALTTLALTVLLMMGGAGLAQVRVTFLNFIALPITFGVSVPNTP